MDRKLCVRFHVVKRIIDIVITIFSLVLLLPVMGVIAILIKMDSPGPVLYVSERMGLGKRPFSLYKFRSMYQNSPPRFASDGSMLVLTNDPRVTRVGRLLRSGFDELPQLFNVLSGQMSLIGPRADPPAALATYRHQDVLRTTVKPGISGLAQVNGRTQISLSQRRVYDLAYVQNQSWRLETVILLLTFFELLPFSRWGGMHVQEYLKRQSLELADCSLSMSDNVRRGNDV